jgi:hypothetical protein
VAIAFESIFLDPRYHEVGILDYRPPSSNMALSRVPGDEELYVGG